MRRDADDPPLIDPVGGVPGSGGMNVVANLTWVDLTWSCLACGEERPDDAIGVTYQPVLGAEHLYPDIARFNVRHCTDRPACALVASRPDWQRLREAVWRPLR